jgi:hypothetical protein
LEAYKATQKKLKKILASPNFLGEVLSQFFGCHIHVPPPKNTFKLLLLEKLQKENNIAALLGQDLYSNLQKEEATPEEIAAYIQKLKTSKAKQQYQREIIDQSNLLATTLKEPTSRMEKSSFPFKDAKCLQEQKDLLQKSSNALKKALAANFQEQL